MCCMFRNLNVEYEYVFVNGDLDIDKIMNKARRKRMFSVDADQMELLAPVGSVELNAVSKRLKHMITHLEKKMRKFMR